MLAVTVALPAAVLPARGGHGNTGDNHRCVLGDEVVIGRVHFFGLRIGYLQVEVRPFADLLLLKDVLLQLAHGDVQAVEGDRVEVEAALELVVHRHGCSPDAFGQSGSARRPPQ